MHSVCVCPCACVCICVHACVQAAFPNRCEHLEDRQTVLHIFIVTADPCTSWKYLIQTLQNKSLLYFCELIGFI